MTKEDCEKLEELLDKLTKDRQPIYKSNVRKKVITITLNKATYTIERWVNND